MSIDEKLFIPIEKFLRNNSLNTKEMERIIYTVGLPQQRRLEEMPDYYGLAMEMFIKWGLMKFANINQSEFRHHRFTSGQQHNPNKYQYETDQWGSIVVTKNEKTLTEIDALYEYGPSQALTPVVFEITLMTKRPSKKTKKDLKKKIVKNLYWDIKTDPYFCMIRPQTEKDLMSQPLDGHYKTIAVPKIDFNKVVFELMKRR